MPLPSSAPASLTGGGAAPSSSPASAAALPTTYAQLGHDDRLSAGPLPRSHEISADLSHVDPTLDACCRRDAEDSLKAQNKRAVLRRHDRVAAHEKARMGQRQHEESPTLQRHRNPHLVSVPVGSASSSSSIFFEGCRCSYDPSKDGGRDYPALSELRLEEEAERQQTHAGSNGHRADAARSGDGDSDDDELEAFMEGFGGGAEAKEPRRGDNNDDNSDIDDDEDDPLLTDGAPVSEWERQRKLQLLQQLQRLEAARQHGYGGHRSVHPTRVLKVAGLASKPSKSRSATSRIPPAYVVVHLYDPHSMASASLDLYFEQELAAQHPGTMFVRSDGRFTIQHERDLLADLANQASSASASSAGASSSPAGRALAQLLREPEEALPALLAVRRGQLVNAVLGFHRPSVRWVDPSTGRVVPSAVVEWLDRSSDDEPMLRRDPPTLEQICHLRPEELALLDYLRNSNNDEGNGGGNSRTRNEFLTALECNSRVESGNEREYDSYYDCGLPGCRKPYQHQHVGTSLNNESPQSGGGLPLQMLADGGGGGGGGA